jgi:hypothetical protein
MLRIAAFTGSLMLVATTALAQDKTAIEKLNDAWTAAFNKGMPKRLRRCMPMMPMCFRRARPPGH